MMAQIYRNIIDCRKVYSIIVLELIIATALFTYAANHKLSDIRDMRAISDNTAGAELVIDVLPNSEKINSFVPTADEINILHEGTNGGAHCFAVMNSALWKDDEADDLYIMFTNNDMVSGDQVLVSEKIWNKIGEDARFAYDDMSAGGESEIMICGHSYNITLMPEDLKCARILTDIDSEYIPFEDAVVFPIGDGEIYEEFIKRAESIYSYIYLDNFVNENEVWNTINVLENMGNGNYVIRPRSMEQESSAFHNYSIMIPQYFGKVAVIILAMTFVGLAGAYNIILERRRAEHAVMIAIGISEQTIVHELAAEIFVVNGLGITAGSVMGEILTKIYPFDQIFTVYCERKTLIIVLCIWAMLSIMIIIPVAKYLYKLSPAQILHGE